MWVTVPTDQSRNGHASLKNDENGSMGQRFPRESVIVSLSERKHLAVLSGGV